MGGPPQRTHRRRARHRSRTSNPIASKLRAPSLPYSSHISSDFRPERNRTRRAVAKRRWPVQLRNPVHFAKPIAHRRAPRAFHLSTHIIYSTPSTYVPTPKSIHLVGGELRIGDADSSISPLPPLPAPLRTYLHPLSRLASSQLRPSHARALTRTSNPRPLASPSAPLLPLSPLVRLPSHRPHVAHYVWHALVPLVTQRPISTQYMVSTPPEPHFVTD